MPRPRLVVATTNYDKLAEIRDILGDLPAELVTLAAFPPVDPPEETGPSFAQNARDKALYYARATGAIVVAEDSGLEIDALGGAPGVESARFGGVNSTYPEKFALIYEALRASPSTNRAARFVCALAVATGDRIVFETQGTIEGYVAAEPRGSGGFGYDPIFFYPPFGCTLAQAAERKSSVSHRAKAFGELRRYLQGSGLQASGSGP